MSNKNLRNTMRLLHLITAVVIGTYIYSPWSADPVFTAAVRFIILPFISLTGIVMWQQPRISRWLRGKRTASTV